MVDTGILSNNMRYPSPECNTTFWMMTIYSDTLYWSGFTQFFTLLLIWILLHVPNLTFNLIARGFNRTFETGLACRQRTLTPPDTWSCKCSNVLSWTCLVSGLLSFEHPSVLSFCFVIVETFWSWLYIAYS